MPFPWGTTTITVIAEGAGDVAHAAHNRAESRRAAACGRAQLLAKKGASGRMQRPAELVPIPECGVKAWEGFGKLRKVAAFRKNLEKSGQNFF